MKYRRVKRRIGVGIGRHVETQNHAVIDWDMETPDWAGIDKVVKMLDGAGKGWDPISSGCFFLGNQVTDIYVQYIIQYVNKCVTLAVIREISALFSSHLQNCFYLHAYITISMKC